MTQSLQWRWAISGPFTFSHRPLGSDFGVDFIYIYLFVKVVCKVEMKNLVCAAHNEIHTTVKFITGGKFWFPVSL